MTIDEAMTQDELDNRQAEWNGEPIAIGYADSDDIVATENKMVFVRGTPAPVLKRDFEDLTYHARQTTTRELLQTMRDDLDGIYPLPKLKREVLTTHLIARPEPRYITRDEFKQMILIPIMLAATIASFFSLVVP